MITPCPSQCVVAAVHRAMHVVLKRRHFVWDVSRRSDLTAAGEFVQRGKHKMASPDPEVCPCNFPSPLLWLVLGIRFSKFRPQEIQKVGPELFGVGNWPIPVFFSPLRHCRIHTNFHFLSVECFELNFRE